MPSITRALSRAGLVGGAALVAAALTMSPANAESRDLAYTCDFGIGEVVSSGPASATWNSAIGDDLTVEVGEPVTLDPFTGSITVPEEFRTMIRTAELDPIEGAGGTLTVLDETGDEFEFLFEFPSTEVPGTGPLVLQVVGESGEDVVPTEAGPYTLLAGDFGLSIDTGVEGPDAGMDCQLVDEGDIAIDAFAVAAAATPTGSPTTTVAPTRPVVVQTDFAGEDGASALPLVLGGGLLAAGGAAFATGRARVRAASRRH